MIRVVNFSRNGSVNTLLSERSITVSVLHISLGNAMTAKQSNACISTWSLKVMCLALRHRPCRVIFKLSLNFKTFKLDVKKLMISSRYHWQCGFILRAVRCTARRQEHGRGAGFQGVHVPMRSPPSCGLPCAPIAGWFKLRRPTPRLFCCTCRLILRRLNVAVA
jgi:hypothetical protein